MEIFNVQFYLLIISIVLMIMCSIYLIRQKERKQLQSIFIANLACTLIISIGVLLQIVCSTVFDVPPFLFENFIYIGTCLFPVFFLLTSLVFVNTKLTKPGRNMLLFIVPIVSLVILWTNNYHHLFYQTYSLDLKEVTFGLYFPIHTVYSYLCILVAIFILIIYSIKNSGFFSKQSLLICIGAAISLSMNILSTLGVFNTSVYTTPISFSVAVLFIALAIFKFDFLKVTPIALQKIVDRISDSYVVISEKNIITDFNQTFLSTFGGKPTDVRNKDLFALIEKHSELNIDLKVLKEALEKAKKVKETVIIEKHFSKINKYFHIEINRIETKGNFLGVLILFKDVTQHNIDMQTIKNNQEVLVEQERLASLGQMIGGIAHNLKTPIMSIAGAAEGLTDLIKEYDSSIGDKDVTEQDHHDIAKDMLTWVDKVKDYTAYMSDVITAVKGQAVTLSEEQSVDFTIEELVKRINILMKHELKNALVTLNSNIGIYEKTELKGNINSLVQVVNNMISNAIQSYNGKPDQKIDMNIYKEKSNVIIEIEDYGSGLPKKVQDKLFKEMITTKGKNGTGLGLFMSYSNIRAHFNGNITFKTEQGKGTTFYISLPLE